MAEPLEQLLQHISRKRPHRRSEYQPAALLGDPGIRSQAMADSAQGVDISDAAPSTRLRAQRFDPDVYAQDEAPEPDEGGEQPDSPFQFASMTEQPTPASSVQYRKECGPNGCRMVPVFEEQQSFPSMAPAMSTVMPQAAPQLPPGVTLGPGETLVPGSVRESSSSIPSSIAMPQQGGASPAAPGPLDDVMQYFGPAVAAYQSMAGSASNPMLAGVAYKALGDFHTGVGKAALEQRTARELREAAQTAMKQNNEIANRKLDLAQEKNDIESGRMAMRLEDEIRKLPLPPAQKAARIVHHRLKALQGVVQLQSKDLDEMYDAEFGIVTANDVADLYQAGQTIGDKLNKTAWSDPQYNTLQANSLRIQGDMRQRAYDRFGKHEDPTVLRQAVQGELFPVIYKTRFDHFTKGGMQDDEAHYRASVAAGNYVDSAVEGVRRMQTGEPAHHALNEWYRQTTGKAVPQSPPPAPAPTPQPAQEDAEEAKSWLDAWTGRTE